MYIEKKNEEQLVEKLLELGTLSLKFARVDRVTFHEDGKLPESDTDHTVMLSLMACSLAKTYAPELDLGKIAQFAMIHDFVESYAGDTNSFGITEEGKKKKDEIEHDAFLRIKKEFGDIFPWIHETIEEYETLTSKEARFIKTLDKCMPRITHNLNQASYFRKNSKTRSDFIAHIEKQHKIIREGFGSEFPLLLRIMEALTARVATMIPE